jgi:hypothetical protein
VFYLGFKVYSLHCVLATQARVCGPGCTGCTEPSRIRIRGIRATGLLIYSYTPFISYTSNSKEDKTKEEEDKDALFVKKCEQEEEVRERLILSELS